MPLPKYVVRLSGEERAWLDGLIHTGKRSASVLIHARLLLKADAGASGPGWEDGRIALPVLLGLFSLVTLIAQQRVTGQAVPVRCDARSVQCLVS